MAEPEKKREFTTLQTALLVGAAAAGGALLFFGVAKLVQRQRAEALLSDGAQAVKLLGMTDAIGLFADRERPELPVMVLGSRRAA